MPYDRTSISVMGLYGKCMLTIIAFLLGVIALQPLAHPNIASAQSNYNHLYIEPRTTMLRNPDGTQQLEGKVVIDLRNGNIWGFPTLSSAPYPMSDTMGAAPPVSAPMYLGKFDFSKMNSK